MNADERPMVSLGRVRFDPLEEQSGLDPGDDNDDEFSDTRTPGVWIVQVRQPLQAADATRLKAEFQVRLTEFVPQNAYVERLGKGMAGQLRADPLIRAVVPFRNDFKFAPTIAPVDPAEDDDFGAFKVALFDTADPAEVAARLTQLGAQDVATQNPQRLGGLAVIAFSMSRRRLDEVGRIAGVRWIEPFPDVVDDGDVAPTVPVEAPGTAGSIAAAWAAGLHGEGQIIGLLDSGPADLRHCFFLDPGVPEPGPSHRKVVAVRNTLGSPAGGHPTFTSGCAAGDDVNQPGRSPLRGGAWAARLVLGNRLALSCFNLGHPELATTLLEELTAATLAGAMVHSNSWHAKPQGGGKPAIYDLVAIDVDTFTWNDENQLVLGSSGNTGEEQGPPGVAKNAVGVGAARSDVEHPVLGDGNSGPTADGLRKPDLMAVGCGILSAAVDTPCEVRPRQDCASSYATPFAAASAVLARQYFLEGRHPTGRPVATDVLVPSGALLKAILVSSTRPAVAGFPHDAAGWGQIDLRRTLHLDQDGGRLLLWDVRNADGLGTGEFVDHEFEVQGSAEGLRVTLVWTEPPGSPGGQPMVNELVVEVTDPAGQVLLGNVLVDGESAPCGAPDRLNNVQIVSIAAPAPGTWIARIRAVAVNVGAPGQGYALVITGGSRR
jgi:hypothetical protein